MEKKYWFKRRRYGWGWMPVTWQGWLVTLIFVALLLALGFMFDDDESFGLFFVYFFPLLASFILITAKTSPKPKWRWGKSESDDPEEDF